MGPAKQADPWEKNAAYKSGRRVLVIGAIVALVFVFVFAGSTYRNRFRLTIEVETPDGLKSGSSVIETRFWESGNWGTLEARGVRADARGEAVYVDLGRGKYVIGILGWGPKGEDQNKISGLTRAALAPGQHVDWKDEYKLKGRGDLPPGYVPALVTFADLNDPKTARVVRPDELAQVFGPGVRFVRAGIETTSGPITRTIKSHLRWLPHPSYLSGRFGCAPNEPHCLHGGNFTR